MASDDSSRGLGLRRLGGNAVLTLFAQGSAAIVGLGLSILLARTLGPEGNGVYALALLLPGLLVQFLEFGITYANVYHVGRGDVCARQSLRTSLRLWGIITVVGLAAAGVIIAFWGSTWFPGVPVRLMIIAVLSFPPNLLQFYCQSILQGKQDFKRFNFLTAVVPVTTFVLSAVLILGFGLGLEAALVAYLVGQLISLGVTLWVLRPYLAAEKEDREPREHWWGYGRRVIGYAWRQYVGSVITFLNYRVDLFLVNLLMSPASAGIYYVAIQFGQAMWIVSKAVSTVLLPRLAQLHGEEHKRLELTPLVSRLVFGGTLLAALLLALVAKPVVGLLYGAEFAGAVMALLLLLPGIVCDAATRIISYDFSARGKPEYNYYLSPIVVVINVAANLLLIPRFGIVGGAIATSIAYAANLVATIVLYRRFNRISWHRLVLLQRSDVALLRDAAGMLRRRAAGSR
jgi:O-antigen/teichoic acid export membrane protein